jgi:homocysteine S-methyltransferase
MTPGNVTDIRNVRVLDGGLATELERSGISLDGILWSARALRDAPEAILAVHRDYLAAGADCLLTASYQASTLGFAEAFARQENVAGFEVDPDDDPPPTPYSRYGPALDAFPEAAVEFSPQARIFAMARAAARAALQTSVRLAAEARAEFHKAGHTRPILIAASLGPYGAALHNGAEFHGNYNAGFAELVEFHRERIAVLAPGGAVLPGLDLLAFETVPSLEEARAILAALSGFPALQAWVSFSCRDEQHVAHGERLFDCAALLNSAPQVVAVGINCTAPALITPLLAELRAGTAKPAIVYPNSGEGWDAVRRCWTGTADVARYGAMAVEWFAAGAQMVGGCCRTGPAHIRAVRVVADQTTEHPGWDANK